MRHRGPPSQVLLCCAVLCCAAVLFSTRFLPHVLLVTAMSLSVVVRVLRGEARETPRRRRRDIRLPCEGSAAGLQLRERFVPAALLAVLRTALALRCFSKARAWKGHVGRWHLPSLCY
jgi:hypothetical protein